MMPRTQSSKVPAPGTDRFFGYPTQRSMFCFKCIIVEKLRPLRGAAPYFGSYASPDFSTLRLIYCPSVGLAPLPIEAVQRAGSVPMWNSLLTECCIHALAPKIAANRNRGKCIGD